ncbi:MAG: serine/threonine-protein kinase [Bryobacteraceae bacterium]|jgi:serine/threonine-protein kinase
MSQLGRYEIIEQMGTGAMGNVYRARDTALDRAVALKTIRTGVDVDQGIRQRFYREARACARLQHPNIITVFDLGEVENTAYIAMELLEGADFRRIIQECRPIPVEAKIAAAAEICDAIAHAHRHGVIHRDIKPSNLFLTKEGRTKVLDFGIARLPSSRLTVAGQILGTPNYMAPEQILANPSDGRADLFSVAVVFFELLTYVHPFQSKFIPGRIVLGEPDSLFDGNTSLPVLLEKVIARGLEKDPNQRYQTGDEFAADLRTVLDALRGNASPSFSGIQLPSDNAIPPARIQPEPVSSVAVPEGQDAQEWRLSEALRLLPEFEAAIKCRDLDRAQAAVVDLEGRLAGDVRFTEAIRLCRSRLLELGSENGASEATPPDQSTSSVAGDTLAESPLVHPPQANAAGAGSVDLDATLFGSSAATAVDLPSQPSQPPFSDVPAEAASPTYATSPEITRPNLERWKSLGIAGAIVVCAISVLIAGIVALRPVPVEPSIATAVVSVASANVFAGPGATAKKIAAVSSGTQLNVLRLPTSRDQKWINVQVVRPKVFRPGYVRVAELRDWHGKTSVAALALIRMFSPGKSGAEGEISGQIQELNNLASRFSGDPAAKEARLDAARLRLSLAQRRKSSGSPPEEWQSELKEAQQELEPLAGDQVFRAQALDLTVQIDKLLAAKPSGILSPSPTALAPPPASPSVSELLARAGQLREDGDYLAAERMIDQILRISPRNKDAQALRDKIRRAHDIENK